MKRAAGFVVFRKIRSNFEYLMMQTSYGEHHWTPPKGHVDPGESDLETAYRETVEEAGLEKKDLNVMEDVVKVVEYNVNGKPKTVTYWLAELIDSNKEIKLSDEHQDYKWLKLEEAKEYGKYPEMKEVLTDFECYLRKNSPL